MTDWHKIVEFFLMYGAAVISPGPNFVMVVRESASSTRKAGLMMTAGFGVGLLMQATAAAFGLKILFETYPGIIKAIQYLGAIYLGYLGLVGILSKPKSEPQEEEMKGNMRSLAKSFKTGLLTHLSNPYATIFTFSTFALFYNPCVCTRIIYILVALFLVVGWYGTVAVFLTDPRLQTRLYRFRHWIDRGAGVVLLYIAFKIGLAEISMR